jgi:hypothetical protein
MHSLLRLVSRLKGFAQVQSSVRVKVKVKVRVRVDGLQMSVTLGLYASLATARGGDLMDVLDAPCQLVCRFAPVDPPYVT